MRRLLVLLALLDGCFELRGPPAFERDASAPLDAPLAPRVLGIDALDARGDAWPARAIPRAVAIRVRASAEIDPASVLLLAGELDEETRDDLAAAPLRASTLARTIPHERTIEGRTITLRPALLERGVPILVAVVPFGADRARAISEPAFVAMRVASDDAAGARAIEAWPPDGASSVGASMPIAAVRFDGIVHGVEDALFIAGPDGAAVPGVARAARCGEIGWPEGHCAVILPTRALAPGAPHTLRIGELRDATGAILPPFAASFVTALDPDRDPPVLRPPPCAIDEQAHEGLGCVLADDARIELRIAASEPARLELRTSARLLTIVAPRGEASLAIDGLGPAAAFEIALEATDLAGNTRRIEAEVATTEPLAPIGIAAVLADPHGAEPRQEHVEVRNYGAIPIDLEGFTLADSLSSPGDRIEGAHVLAPGASALLVAADFDPDDRAAGDSMIPPGITLIRLDRSLASGGLGNSGEPLFLRDPALRRISAAPALPAPREGVCIVRSSDDPRTGAIGSFEYDPAGGCSPGRRR